MAVRRALALLAVLSLSLSPSSCAKTSTASSSTSKAAGTGTTKPKTVKTEGPYTEVGNKLAPSAKSKFFQLLKRMREVKNSDVPELQKNTTRRAMNGEMQKLLGDEMYQQYRKIRVANTAKAKSSGAAPSAAAPHVALAGPATIGKPKTGPKTSKKTTSTTPSATASGGGTKKKKPSAAPTSATGRALGEELPVDGWPASNE